MSQKILIIGPSWVGDTVMAQALFKLLKQRDATLRIEVLAPTWTFSLLQCMPEVAKTIELPMTHGELKLGKRYALAKQLREQHYDQAIILPNSFKSALIPWLAHIPKRTGWVGECRYLLLNDVRRLNKKRYPLMVEQYLALGLPSGADLPASYPHPAFKITIATQKAALAKHLPIYRRDRPILAICAGAEFGPAKRWPEEYYAKVAKKKISEGWDVWLFGSNKDRVVAEKIRQLMDHRGENLAGRLALFETIALLSLSSGVVTNDSGLMHVAAALEKPLIALYGPTSPAFTPPLSANAQRLSLHLPCQPCFARTCALKHHHCMRHLTPDYVLQAMNQWGVN